MFLSSSSPPRCSIISMARTTAPSASPAGSAFGGVHHHHHGNGSTCLCFVSALSGPEADDWVRATDFRIMLTPAGESRLRASLGADIAHPPRVLPRLMPSAGFPSTSRQGGFSCRSKERRVLAALAAVIIVTALSAQEGGLTIEKAVEIAQSRNPDVLAARTAIEAARGRTLQLRPGPSPDSGQRRGRAPSRTQERRRPDRGQPRDRAGLRIPGQALSKDRDRPSGGRPGPGRARASPSSSSRPG